MRLITVIAAASMLVGCGVSREEVDDLAARVDYLEESITRLEVSIDEMGISLDGLREDLTVGQSMYRDDENGQVFQYMAVAGEELAEHGISGSISTFVADTLQIIEDAVSSLTDD